MREDSDHADVARRPTIGVPPVLQKVPKSGAPIPTALGSRDKQRLDHERQSQTAQKLPDKVRLATSLFTSAG